jgi:hypothetical protein
VRLKNGAWHLQYRNGDGKIKSAVLVRRDDVYYSATCDAVKELAAKRLAELSPKATAAKPDMRVVDFGDQVYTPWAKETNPLVGEANLRASTLTGYKQIWERHLKPHFGDKTMRGYTPSTAVIC